MKYLPPIVGVLLGLLFVAGGLVMLLNLAPMPPLPEGSPAAHFMAAFIPTGYMTFIKVLEVIGGILVAIPKTRNFGLLVLGPIIVNILAYHVFVLKCEGLDTAPVLIPIVIITVLPLYLLWNGRKQFAGLLR